MALIYYLTQIQFDFGASALLKDECVRVGIKRPLVVTDQGVVAAGVAERALASITGVLPHSVFDETPGNPTEAMVLKALAQYRAHGADGLIAIGGGSSMDLAKAVAILATHPEPLTQYATIEGGSPKITSAAAPLIAIPTTSGTGSEVARGAIIVLNDGRKVGFHSWNLMPKAAICDPDLTLGLPPGLTAATGMDAAAHCIETFLSAAFNPPAEGIALDGLERAMKWIRTAVNEGSNREARRQMMSASMQGAMAFQKGLGAVHSLSHALGSYPGKTLHHGTLNAVVLPTVLRFNSTAESVVGQDKYAKLRRAMGLPADAAVDKFIVDINRDIGIASGLGEMGLPRSFFDEAIAKALKDHCHGTNPRIATAEEYRMMLEEAY
ncbi:MAG: iron-containing alcohol dehydrogenase [Betaproteobacteria bacterium]|nr:iron-containing alcohol dehydrogenase [Betaproteobacteria bacterium]